MRVSRLAPWLPLIVALSSACAGLTSPGSSGATFTATDAQNLAKNFAQGATNGVNAGNNASTRGARAFNELPSPVLRGISCNSTGSSCQIFQQYAQTTTCNGGGRMSVSGQINGSVSSGTLGPFGSISLTQNDSIIDWACDGGWVVNGDPQLSDTGTITLTGSHSAFSFREGGGFVAVATTDGTRVSCLLSTSVSWDSSLGGSYSGTANCSPGGTFNISGSF
jgi:hypothetical protein